MTSAKPQFQSPPSGENARDWSLRLAEAGAPRDVAGVIAAMAQGEPGIATARVSWGLEVLSDPSLEPAGPLADADLQLVRMATIKNVPVHSPDGRSLAIPLFTPPTAVLLLALAARGAGDVFAATMAAPLALAGRHLQRALQIADLQASVTRLGHSEQLQRALFAISDLAGSEHDVPEMLRCIHGIVGTLMYAENFFIALHDADRDTLRFLYFADVQDPAPEGEIALEAIKHSLTWYLVRDGKPLMGSTDELRMQVPGPVSVVGTDGFDWLGVPILHHGRVQGVLVVQSYQEGVGYTAEDRALLEFVGSHILTALERKQGKAELEQRVQRRTLELADAVQGLQLEIVERQRAERLQGALFQIAQLATADISQDEFYLRVHLVVGELMNADNFFIGLLSDDRQSLEFPYYVDGVQRAQPPRPMGRGLSEYVLRTGAPLMGSREDIEALGRAGHVELKGAGSPAVCWLGVPLQVGDEVIGLVAVQSYVEAVRYGPADRELLGFVASQIANSLNRRRAAAIQQQAYAQLEERVQERTTELRKQIQERERIEEQLQHQVMHDALTGLPNRGYLRDRLERVLARLKRDPKCRSALLYLDIDRFKIVNDSLGHLAGDQLLKEVARRLQTCVRAPDVVARLAGDEFAILLEEVEVPATAIKVAQRVLHALNEPLDVAERVLRPTTSIGIAMADHRYHLADEVLRDADIALYRAKELGRNRFEMFDATMQRNAINVLAIEGELREALARDQFEPYFQPIVRLDNHAVVGHEALLRWNHPQRGLLGPGDFMQIAADSGSFEAIDWRMFEISCGAATRLGSPKTCLALNVSPLHLARADFEERLHAILARTGLPPGRLVLEVTEGSLLVEPDRVRALLDRLHDAGIGTALDDFGTGYSSLSYLHTFPLRMLKIDRSFVAGLGTNSRHDSATVVASVLALARALGMQVVAEGIETEDQRRTLLEMGCELGQGYLLGRPAPLEHWLPAQSGHE